MTTIPRLLPDINKSRINVYLLGSDSSQHTVAVYNERLEAFEKQCEKAFIETLYRVNIQATVKSDRYSLPFTQTLEVSLLGESYLNAAFDIRRVANHIVKELLNRGVTKLRFFLFVNVEETGGHQFGKVNYLFCYYPH